LYTQSANLSEWKKKTKINFHKVFHNNMKPLKHIKTNLQFLPFII
jgi:hypothetical protein